MNLKPLELTTERGNELLDQLRKTQFFTSYYDKVEFDNLLRELIVHVCRPGIIKQSHTEVAKKVVGPPTVAGIAAPAKPSPPPVVTDTVSPIGDVVRRNRLASKTPMFLRLPRSN